MTQCSDMHIHNDTMACIKVQKIYLRKIKWVNITKVYQSFDSKVFFGRNFEYLAYNRNFPDYIFNHTFSFDDNSAIKNIFLARNIFP